MAATSPAFITTLARGRPVLVHFEVTHRCNARCSFCDFWRTDARAREHELFVELRTEAAAHVPALQAAASTLGRLDAEAALAEAAARYGWTRPVVEDSDRLVLDAARHPVVERLLPRGEFVPNGVRLDAATRQVLLLTGPNMGGKSTYLRQIALVVILAQSGSFVPAASATVGLVDRLFTRVGAADRLGAGQSTFMVEMAETAEILRGATARSLVLLDEIGRGTATYDGLALAWAVTEHLHAGSGARPRTVFATHYHELTQLAGTLPRLANVHVTVKEWGDGVVFLHRIAEGPADRSYGIHVARLAGLPESILARAREVLAELESERTVEHLEPAARGSRRRATVTAPLPLFESAAAEEHPIEAELRCQRSLHLQAEIAGHVHRDLHDSNGSRALQQPSDLGPGETKRTSHGFLRHPLQVVLRRDAGHQLDVAVGAARSVYCDLRCRATTAHSDHPLVAAVDRDLRTGGLCEGRPAHGHAHLSDVLTRHIDSQHVIGPVLGDGEAILARSRLDDLR